MRVVVDAAAAAAAAATTSCGATCSSEPELPDAPDLRAAGRGAAHARARRARSAVCQAVGISDEAREGVLLSCECLQPAAAVSRHGLSRPLPLACYLTASVPHCILLHQWHAARRPSGQFGINTFTGQEHGTGDDKQPPSKFNPPVDLDTDQWVESCVAMGGSYAVFTAKHEEGMMNWPSKSTNYSIESSPFCRARKQAGRSCDLVGEFLASCDKYNITRGLYYTIANSHCRTVPSGGAPGNVSCDDMLRNAFTELATDYGPIGQFWFDHGNELFVDLVDKYQPGAHSDMQKRFFSNSLTFNSRFNMIIYQDRLGTNEGKALQKKTAYFRRCVHRRSGMDTCWDRGCEERLLHPFLKKNGRFAKTGLDKSRTSEGKEAFCAGGYVLDGPNTLWSPAYPMVRKIALLRCH